MEARLNKGSFPNYLCTEHADWYTIWVNLEVLVPLLIDCWADNIRLVYDNVTHTTRDPIGVETRVPGWGQTRMVEYLDPMENLDPFGSYMWDLVHALVQTGYTRDLNIHSTPYDFRKAPNENTAWFNKTKKLIEESFSINGNEPVTMICHSMGCLMTLTFLQQQTQAWKDQFISKLITLAAPWGGSVKSLKTFAVGDNLDVILLSEEKFRRVLRTWPSLVWIFPSPLFWGAEEVLISSMARDYTVNDMKTFFTDVHETNGWEMRKDTLPFLVNADQPPNVPVHCIFGDKVATTEKLNYFTDDLFSNPELVHGNGDSVVNIRSLRGCERWIGKQSQEVDVTVFPGATHYKGMVFNPVVIKHVVDLLS